MKTRTALLAASPLLAATLVAAPVAAAYTVATPSAVARPALAAAGGAVSTLAGRRDGPLAPGVKGAELLAKFTSAGLAKFTSSVAPAILTTKSCGSIVAGWSCI